MAKKILLIEDEEMMSNLIKRRLEANGYEVATAFDGQTGLELARQSKPDLILLDIMLPKLDGYKVCRFLKFDDKYKVIPIIMLTALGQDTDIALGRDMGADAYLVKPFDSQTLLGKIQELLEKKA